jgi:hypothetical protein
MAKSHKSPVRVLPDLTQVAAPPVEVVAPRVSSSCVKEAYRLRYRLAGNPRGCNDWLHQVLDELCTVRGRFDVPTFEHILELHGIPHARWNRTTNGWQGRLRMSGRLALQTVVAKTRVLLTVDGEVAAPAEWRRAQ